MRRATRRVTALMSTAANAFKPFVAENLRVVPSRTDSPLQPTTRMGPPGPSLGGGGGGARS